MKKALQHGRGKGGSSVKREVDVKPKVKVRCKHTVGCFYFWYLIRRGYTPAFLKY